MPHHPMPPPTQPGSGGNDAPVSVQNPFSDGPAMTPGVPSNYQRQNYGPIGGVPNNSGSYDNRNVPYGSRQPTFPMGHQGEQFENTYINQDGGNAVPPSFPGTAR